MTARGSGQPIGLVELDPLDLADWLGTAQVTWHAEDTPDQAHLVPGRLEATEGSVACDLLAVDRAHPLPVAGEDLRRAAHQAWHNGQVLLITHEGRTTMAVPGVDFPAGRVLEALARFAKAVGAQPTNFVAALRVGAVRAD